MVKKKAGRKGKLSLDFTGVESGGKAVPDGSWLAEVISVEEKEGQDSGAPYLKWKWKVLKGPGKGGTVYDNTSLQPQALWKLRGLLESLGFKVPEGAMDFDPDDVVGELATLVIVNEDYNNKPQPRVTAVSGAEGAPEEEEEEKEEEEEEEEEEEKGEEEKPTKKGGAKKSSGSKIKVGSKVKFDDEDGKTIRGVVTSIDGDDAQIEDKSGEEWEVATSELELA